MMRRCVLGVATALALTGCGYAGLQDLPLPGSPPVGNNPFSVTAHFTDVANLTRDTTVKLNGVTVGRVSDITRNGWTATVTLTLQNTVSVPANVHAEIEQTGLLGEQYVALVQPANPSIDRLHDNSEIPSGSTSTQYDVEEVLGALSLLLNGGGLNQLQTITTQLRNALVDRSSTKAFISELDQFVTTLDHNRSLIISTMRNVSSLTSQLAAEKGTVSQAIDSISRATHVLANQQSEVRALLKHLDGFSQSVTRVVQTSGGNLRATLVSLEPVLAQLQGAGNKLPQVIGTVLSFPFPDNVLTAVHGNYVNLDVLVDLSPLVLAGNFIGPGRTPPNLG
ncbi:MAG TPA: MCE family protein, partial [Marmoricola sp.]|nr:MCE family protein [Marmoricola sp.]